MRFEGSTATWVIYPWKRRLRRLTQATVALLLAVIAGGLGYVYSLRAEMASLRADGGHRLDLFAAAVGGIVKRLEHVPATVQLNPEVLELLHHPKDERRVLLVNRYLRSLNAYVGGVAIFVMDERGIVLASSNFDQTGGSFIGEDLSFRPYFVEGLSGRVGSHFAIGTTHGEPGYYVSHPIRSGENTVGVAVIKISLRPVEDAWNMLGVPAMITDENQVVILTSEPGWRYSALRMPSLARRVDVQMARIYDNWPVREFPMDLPDDAVEEGAEVRAKPGIDNGIGDTHFLMQQRDLDGIGWRLYIFFDLKIAQRRAALQAALAAAVSVLLALSLMQRHRMQRQKQDARRFLEKANVELEQKVAKRTKALTETNARLRKEVAEREQAELTLRAAQDELVQTAKLAVIGQMAAGITHELAQPLSAVRTLAGNAQEFLRRNQVQTAMSNVDLLNRLTEQMGEIIQPLKGFARKSPSVPSRTDADHAINAALMLLDARLRGAEVTIRRLPSPHHCVAWCEQNRLEQVLVNLIGNAIDAMNDQTQERLLYLQIVLGTEGAASTQQRVYIHVADTGPGVPVEARGRIFEPFFTTKPVGVGLGLGLAISRDIAREFGGDLRLESVSPFNGGGGTCFTVCLPLPPDEEPTASDTAPLC